MYKVYGMATSGNCYKVRLTLEQLRLPYEWIEIDVRGGETRRAEFLARNPNGKVPLLEVEPGVFLPESNAIICYLADGTVLLPNERMDRARVLEWLFFEQYSHEPNVAVARYITRYLGAPPDQAQKLTDCLKGGYAAMDVMEQHLKEHEWVAAGRYSVADIALYAYTHVAGEAGFEMDRYPAIGQWLARVKTRPGHVPMPSR